MNPDQQKNGTCALENSPDTRLQLEYYKNKNNGIERHLDDALKIALATCVSRSHAEIKQLIDHRNSRIRMYQNGQPQYDPLTMKEIIKTSEMPSIETSFSVEDYKVQVADACDINKRFEKMFEGLTEDEIAKQEKKFEKESEEWNMYTENLNQLFYAGKSKIMSFGNQSVIMTSAPIQCVARINIKVPADVSPYHVVMQLAEKFTKNEAIIEGGFQMKSLRGQSSDRDSVIIYATQGSFKNIVSVVREQFRNDYHYHDRNAEPAIFGGVALEDEDGSKFPSVRVCAEPESISRRLSSHWTFNDLQATILSEAVIDYINNNYNGDKEAMVKDFSEKYLDAYERWCERFPKLYKQAVGYVLGDEEKAKNIAFF